MKTESSVRITFGMIVLNGMPFLKYNLEALYPFAHQVIVVEGACRAAAGTARPDGHSQDGTHEFLQDFGGRHDPERKLEIVTAMDEGLANGFWAEKGQMSEAYAKRTTGDYLWQIDTDEFYMPEDMDRIIRLLGSRPDIKAVSFNFYNCWGGAGYVLDGYAFQTRDCMVHRVFRWRPGHRYVTHRPPTVVDEHGTDLRELGWLSNLDTACMGIFMYHYDMILPKQAANKSSYYSCVKWHKLEGRKILDWETRVFDHLEKPFRIYTIHSHFSWLKRYEGKHPPAVDWMISDIEEGVWPGVELRRTDDIERMLRSPRFHAILPLVKLVVTVQVALHNTKVALRRMLVSGPLWPAIQWLCTFSELRDTSAKVKR